MFAFRIEMTSTWKVRVGGGSEDLSRSMLGWPSCWSKAAAYWKSRPDHGVVDGSFQQGDQRIEKPMQARMEAIECEEHALHVATCWAAEMQSKTPNR